jgi:hypothetical protein
MANYGPHWRCGGRLFRNSIVIFFLVCLTFSVRTIPVVAETIDRLCLVGVSECNSENIAVLCRMFFRSGENVSVLHGTINENSISDRAGEGALRDSNPTDGCSGLRTEYQMPPIVWVDPIQGIIGARSRYSAQAKLHHLFVCHRTGCKSGSLGNESEVLCGGIATIFDNWCEPPIGPTGRTARSRWAGALFDLEFRKADKGSLSRSADRILIGRNLGLLVHDFGLSQIDKQLRESHDDQRDSQQNLYPVRSPQIDERFRGVPMALGWFCSLLWGWFVLARTAHKRQSIFFGISALLTMLAAVLGLFGILFWANFAENASASYGLSASAPRYRSLENISIHPVVVPELKFRDVQRQIFPSG